MLASLSFVVRVALDERRRVAEELETPSILTPEEFQARCIEIEKMLIIRRIIAMAMVGGENSRCLTDQKRWVVSGSHSDDSVSKQFSVCMMANNDLAKTQESLDELDSERSGDSTYMMEKNDSSAEKKELLNQLESERSGVSTICHTNEIQLNCQKMKTTQVMRPLETCGTPRVHLEAPKDNLNENSKIQKRNLF